MGPASARDLPGTLLEGIRLAVQGGLDARLVMVGNAAGYAAGRRAMQKVAADRLLRERVNFTGQIPHQQVPQRLLDCDATVLLRPETWETRACFPTRLPEYLLAAHPVILSAAGDIPLYCQHRRNAWLLPPGDQPGELAEALLHLATHREEAIAIGRAGWKTALDEFSYRTHAPRLLGFLERLRRGKEPAHG
jgi:glycosyltransferase involved in cell wall biosynthesis